MNSQRPNIVYVTTDQQHWNTIRALGNPHIHTPNMDRMVSEGVTFNRAYVTNPVCTPSRATMITGEYPSRHKSWHVGVGLETDRPTLGDVLTAGGYDTGLFGKAHFQPCEGPGLFESPPNIYDRDFWRNFQGPYYGFEEVAMVHGHSDSPISHGMHYGAWLVDQGIDPARYYGTEIHRPWGEPWDIPEDLHYTRWTADRTMEFIEKQVDRSRHAVEEAKPFFAWCSFQDPHDKFICPEPWASMYDPEQLPPFLEKEGEMEDKPALHRYLIEGRIRDFPAEQLPQHCELPLKNLMQALGRTNKAYGEQETRKWLAAYYGMISLMDFHLGRILDKLDELGIADNTLVLFTSDHGEYAGHHGLWLKGPIHYEDVIRVPFLTRWKGKQPAGVQTNALMSLVDLAPTFLEAGGLPASPHMQGVSQLQTLLNPEQASRSWCLIENRAHTTYYVKTWVTERYKLNYYLNRNEGELYDLLEDPHEFINLHDKPEYASVRLQLLEEMMDAYGELENPYPPRVCYA